MGAECDNGKSEKEMWPILRSLTINRSMTTARIITDNGKNFVSQQQIADGFARLYRHVSNLKFEEHDKRRVKQALSSRLMDEVVDMEVCQCFTTDEIKADLRNNQN